MGPHELARRVNSRETFLEFVEALRVDWESSRGNEGTNPRPDGGSSLRVWENSELGRFLEAMQAWTEDMGDRLPERPSWGTFAHMLMAATMYE